jgi:hypothetical protein
MPIANSLAISITNQALVLLGAQPITAFNEPTDRAKIAYTMYGPNRKALMRLHPWNCLVKRVQLAPEAAVPAFGAYSHQFVLPGDCLRLLSLGGEGETPQDYQLEGERRVLFGSTVCNVRYIADLGEDKWDDLLTDVMVQRMASVMAYAITKSGTTKADAYQVYQAALKAAKAVDGQENPPEEISDSPLLEARFGGGVY